MRNKTSRSVSEWCWFAAYQCLLYALVWPVATLKLLHAKLMRSNDVSRKAQRLGWEYPKVTPNGYWFHCVSVGEVVAASCVIKALITSPNCPPVTVTTTTETGAHRVRELFGDAVTHLYLPYDLPDAVSRLIEKVSPQYLAITEVELWPNLINQCTKKSIDVVVVNARLTHRSMRQYQRFSGLFAPMFRQLTHVCAQGESDFHHYQALGLDSSRLTLTHNIKFDQVSASQPPYSPGFLGLQPNLRPVIVAGSTHEPEEEWMVSAFSELKTQFPDLLLIVVPRHPQRFDNVESLLEQQPFRLIKSSNAQCIENNTDIVLVDEMGKLGQAYTVATLAFVGGSIAMKGGHNALEPAAESVPVIMGQYTYNNPVICDYLKSRGALVTISSRAELVAACQNWLAHPQLAVAAGAAGFQVLQDNRGALHNTLQVLKTLQD